MHKLILAVALLAAHFAGAQTLTGRVVSVADGDTITVLDSSSQAQRIRLYGIDGPEKRRPFGS